MQKIRESGGVAIVVNEDNIKDVEVMLNKWEGD
jgi:hypothetical protein